MASRFEVFSERTRKVLSYAQEEAQRLNHNYLGTEHILLGLAREDSGNAYEIFRMSGIDLQIIRSSVIEKIASSSGPEDLINVGLTPPVKKIINEAVEYARSKKSNYIGTEHLLYGVATVNGDSIAYEVLRVLGLSTSMIDDKLKSLLSDSEKDEKSDIQTVEEPRGSFVRIPKTRWDRIQTLYKELGNLLNQ